MKNEQLLKTDNHRSNLILNGLSLEKSGIYTFRLQTQENEKWITVHEIPLTISLESESTPKELPEKIKKLIKPQLETRKIVSTKN